MKHEVNWRWEVGFPKKNIILAEQQANAHLPRTSTVVIQLTVWSWVMYGSVGELLVWVLWHPVEPVSEVCEVFTGFIFICQTFVKQLSSGAKSLVAFPWPFSSLKSSFCQWLRCTQLFPLLPPCPYNSSHTAVSRIWKATRWEWRIPPCLLPNQLSELASYQSEVSIYSFEKFWLWKYSWKEAGKKFVPKW